MYDVKFSQKSIDRILSYIDMYRRYYEALYSDTGLGIDTENIIIDQYRETAEAMKRGFRSITERILKEDSVLGYAFNSNTGTYTVTSSLGTRRIFIEYLEYTDKHLRIVLDIQIIRK